MANSYVKYGGKRVTPGEVKADTNWIRLEGMSETMNALRAFEPEVYKQLTKLVRSSVNRVKQGAQAIYGGKYVVRTSYVGKRPSGSVTAIMGAKKSPNDWSDPATKAVVFEFAGTRSSGATPQMKGALRFFDTFYGRPGRFLWSAYDSIKGDIERDLKNGMATAERELQRRLDSAGEGF